MKKMKKNLLNGHLMSALLCCILLLNACDNSPSRGGSSGTAEETKEDVIKTGTSSSNTGGCGVCDSTEGHSVMSAVKFKALISNYRNHHWAQINQHHFNGNPNKVDSRSVWFDLNTLKNFILNIEKSVADSCGGDHCSKQLGIRIYFAEYGGAATPILPEYDSLHTLVMVPTMRMTTQVTGDANVDFDYAHMQGCNPLPIDSTWPEFTALMPTIPMRGAMNHGTLIPPPYQVCTGARFMHLIDRIDFVTSAPSCPY
jgi:hypothetical protein